MQDQIMNSDDERDRTEEGSVEVGDVEEINFGLSDVGWKMQLFIEGIE